MTTQQQHGRRGQEDFTDALVGSDANAENGDEKNNNALNDDYDDDDDENDKKNNRDDTILSSSSKEKENSQAPTSYSTSAARMMESQSQQSTVVVNTGGSGGGDGGDIGDYGSYFDEQQEQQQQEKARPDDRFDDYDDGQSSYHTTNTTTTTYTDPSTPRPMCSVLNIVIDHTMEDITPFEQDEWQLYKEEEHRRKKDEARQQKRKQQQRQQKNDANTGVDQMNALFPGESNSKDDDAAVGEFLHSGLASTSVSSKVPTPRIRVPVLRVFGPLLRGPASFPFPPPVDASTSPFPSHSEAHTTTTTATSSQPIQSACLHIHGAFPYLLARPVVAGPDGSIFHYGDDDNDDNNNNKGGDDNRRKKHRRRRHVNWDSRVEVERLTNNIHAVLEESIQGLFDNSHSGSKKATNNNIDWNNSHAASRIQQQPQYRVIRKVTVVEGRGFYGYCPGPPAPFLRIEYYDPKLRWKVKLVLEKGLSSLPSRYHPNPHQYKHYDKNDDSNKNTGRGRSRIGGNTNTTTSSIDSSNRNDGKTSEVDSDDDDDDDGDDQDLDELDVCEVPLKFRCYEAHIPYTMQFFKDYNLAGMSYIHITNGKIRGSLPSSHQPTIKNKFIQLKTNSTEAGKGDSISNQVELSVFLSSNTPKKYLWSRPRSNLTSTKAVSTTSDIKANENEASNDTAFSTPKKSQRKNPSSLRNDGGSIGETEGVFGRYSPGQVPDTPLRQPSQESVSSVNTSDALAAFDAVGDARLTDSNGVDKLTPKDSDNAAQATCMSKGKQSSSGKIGGVDDIEEEDDKESSHVDFNPPSRITSCDVEIDCSVDDILNVLAVMTTMPSDQEERDQVHWRAVPSLQEWWRQEEQRLKKYLAPSLTQEIMSMSQKQKLPIFSPGKAKTGGHSKMSGFKLNIKNESSPRSGTQLAVKGMWSLVKVSGGLGEEFFRSLTDILNRHSQAVLEADMGFREHKISSTGSHSLTEGSSKNGFRDVFTPSEKRDCVSKGKKTPTTHEALDALAGLMDSGGQESMTLSQHDSVESPEYGKDNDIGVFSPHNDCDIDEENAVMALEAMADGGEFIGEPTSEKKLKSSTAEEDTTPTKKLFAQTPDRRSVSKIKNIDDGTSIYDEFQFSQRVDRGESILDDLDDIDPETLCPRDEPDNDEEDASAIEDFLTQSQDKKDILAADPNTEVKNANTTENTPRRVRFADQMTGKMVENQKYFESPAIGKSYEAVIPHYKDEEDDEDGDDDDGGGFGQTDDHIHITVDSKAVAFQKEGGNHDMNSSTRDKKFHESDKSITFDENTYGLSLPGEYVMPVLKAPSRKRVSAWIGRGHRNGSPRKRQKGKSDWLEIDSNSRQIIAVGQEADNTTDQDIVEEVKWDFSQKLSMTQSQASQEERTSRIADESAKFSVLRPESQQEVDPLDGLGAQGGRIHVQGGGGLKAKTRSSQLTATDSVLETPDAMGRSNFFPTPVTIMSVEIHVQCREGESRLGSRKKIPMTPDSNKDKISAIIFVFARDPGGGESLKTLSRGCILTTLEGENPRRESSISIEVQQQLQRAVSRSSFGIVSSFSVEVVKDERQMLLRFKDIVRKRDPDVLLSWDMQGAGIGYIIERGIALGRSSSQLDSRSESYTSSNKSIDMVKLLGRTPMDKRISHSFQSNPGEVGAKGANGELSHDDPKTKEWVGSGMGSDWDDKVGPGAAAASIVGRLTFSAWKTISEEVKHGNASYQPAIVAAVLGRRIPHYNDLTLTKWFASKTERRKVLEHRLDQATASLLLFTDALDIIGRAGEAARLSGVTFAESFPGVRGSQYKVEGVLLRALQSLRSDERGEKKGRRSRSGASSQHSMVSGTSSTGHSKSQTQSPWKLRRQNGYNDNGEEQSISDRDDRQYFFFSPSLEDTNKQEALEVQALTLEPQSGHYTDPVVVCDFTALYPSLIIAYNLCYSTCAGRLEYHSTRREMRTEGKTRGRMGPFYYAEEKTATVLKHHMKSLSSGQGGQYGISLDDATFRHDRAYVSPTGAIYVGENVVKGVLPQVLDEMLTTRAMLKREMKELKKSKRPVPSAVFRQLEARQLALKYVANVTYGYTSATFSGRCAMPTLADTIVELSRRTLRKAIEVANTWGEGTDPWGNKDDRWVGARVIYGDTDSVFVRLPGRSHSVAFEFGEALCAAVTSLNPPPVQLKLEKVYGGSIMQTMKRYCGMKYESKDQKKPVFEAKGLETVRRDQCRLTQEILKNSLIMLFRHGIRQVREYLERQWSMILRDELPVSYFILTGRVRSQYRGGKEGPVQAVLSRRLSEADPGRIVRNKERVPYVIAAIPGKNFTLKDCVLTPMEMLEGWDAYKINARYYIMKLVNAALNRCFKLAPHYVNVNDWYAECPKPRRRVHIWPVKSNASMITSFFGFDICSLCQQKCHADGSKQVVICDDCRQDPSKSILLSSTRLSQVEQAANRVAQECSRCNGCFESADTFAVVQTLPSDNSTFSGDDHNHTNHLFIGGTKKKKGRSERTMLLPLANCNCIDCPNTFRRHRLREQGIEALEAFDLLTSTTW